MSLDSLAGRVQSSTHGVARWDWLGLSGGTYDLAIRSVRGNEGMGGTGKGEGAPDTGLPPFYFIICKNRFVSFLSNLYTQRELELTTTRSRVRCSAD